MAEDKHAHGFVHTIYQMGVDRVQKQRLFTQKSVFRVYVKMLVQLKLNGSLDWRWLESLLTHSMRIIQQL